MCRKYHRLDHSDRSQYEENATCVGHVLDDNFTYNSPGGCGISLVMRLLTVQRYPSIGRPVKTLLSEKFVRNVVTSVGIGKSGHVTIRRI